MTKCKTKTFVQVCRGASREEMESGPSKTVPQRRFCWVALACLHWKGKRRQKVESVRNWLHGGGTENGALLIPPHCQPGTAVQCPHFFIQVPDQKKLQTQHGPKKCFFWGWCGKFEKKKTSTSLDADFSPILYLTFPSFHRAPYHWTTIIPSYGFSNRAEKKKRVLQRVLGYCVHNTFSG